MVAYCTDLCNDYVPSGGHSDMKYISKNENKILKVFREANV